MLTRLETRDVGFAEVDCRAILIIGLASTLEDHSLKNLPFIK